ncbi:hypothetical protein ATO6_12450 [Oceanicola sp. 22II-s10i]|uniref:RNA 2',3'-cyclic phosphodiesterase n=1 Tax=Oceanicola sp. 22II-s10i TaxID=1317116 RepID=UPI000B527E43|nr:RNA 2',3'-cyclic phosphodiesterase [Oceanicola sp. 22II-s10i]OWU84490.1 hypothetical protein ATO6_12450 [Oceanicola sp. 22II-s10i]
MRLFIAIDPPDPVRDALEDVQDHLRAGRLMDPETFHLTLAFLGETDETVAEDLHSELETLIAPAFDLTLSGLGTFGSDWPAVLWAGVADPGPVTDLHRAIRARVRMAGIELPRERFRPHVTLARFRKRPQPGEADALVQFLRAHAAFRSPSFTVDSFVLYHSTRTPEGPLHEELARYPLISTVPDS